MILGSLNLKRYQWAVNERCEDFTRLREITSAVGGKSVAKIVMEMGITKEVGTHGYNVMPYHCRVALLNLSFW